MNRIVFCLMTLCALVPGASYSQSIQGYGRNIIDAPPLQTGKIMMPQPNWSQIADIEGTDGTANPPPCYDTKVLANVGNGILLSEAQTPGGVLADGSPVFTEVSFGDVWVHQTPSGRYVCDTEVQSGIEGNTTLPITPQKWAFETYASDGQVKVFFYNEDAQNTGQN